MTFVTHLECAMCSRRFDATKPHNMCPTCARPLWVRYDLASVGRELSKRTLEGRPATMWRYAELLPMRDPTQIVSLGETMTPLLSAKRLADRFGLDDLLVKDESRLPTGSFKARGMALAISRVKELGVQRVAVPTAGNAGGATAAYAARAGIDAWVFMPEDTPVINQKECVLAGAHTFLVGGLINDCARIVAEGQLPMEWFDLSTLREPYRLEGKKTMGFELAEQLGWELPDVILYPTGGGTGLLGMWKAFAELEALGWLKTAKKPRLYACQSDGCAPIATAFARGERFAPKVEGARTIASGLRVPSVVGDFMVLDAIRQSGGAALALPEAEIGRWMRIAATLEGLYLCPEAAVCLGALETMRMRGLIKRGMKVVLWNTGAAQKYPEAIDGALPRIDVSKPLDWASLRDAA